MTTQRTTTGTRARRVPVAYDQKPGSTVTLLDEDGALVRRTVLPGGLRIVTERLPGVRSAAFGVWVGVGSRDESEVALCHAPSAPGGADGCAEIGGSSYPHDGPSYRSG